MTESIGVHGGSIAVLPGLIHALRTLDVAPDDAGRVDQIRLLEDLKSVTAAVQARVTAEFVDSQRQAQLDAGIKPGRAERGIAAQVALARRTSPFHASRYVGWARILTTELPHTFAALQAGKVNEWRAMLVARETAWLSREHRAVVDHELAPRTGGLSDTALVAQAKRIGYRLDPQGYVTQLGRAESERRVSLRPAPDAMGRLTALLPVTQGVAAYAALSRHADLEVAAGDGRSRGQVMADTLVERVTGQATAQGVPVEVNLVMNPDALFDPDSPDHNEPAILHGHGPVPAPIARQLILDPDRRAPVWLRRLYTRPDDGQLAAMDTRRRLFTKTQRHFVRLRDQTCRTPWCGAPIRHTDHITPAAEGGPTSISNSAGLCAACNHAKQAPGWHATPGRHGLIDLITPTGHHYRSRAPDPPHTSPRRLMSPTEIAVHIQLGEHVRRVA